MATIAKSVAQAAEVTEPTSVTEPVEEFEYVTIPEKDILDYPHPGVAINRESYGPGVHRLPRDIAREVKERLAIFDAANIRIIQPRKDMKALTDLYKFKGAGAVDMTPDNSKKV
jgi:hypothetical protein